MSKKSPITVSSWTLGDQCTFEERVSAAKEAGLKVSASVLKRMSMPWLKAFMMKISWLSSKNMT